MRVYLSLFLILLFFVSCSNFKILKPNPKIRSKKNGFIRILSDKENFEIDKGKKYLILFPSPEEDKTTLVLKISNKDNVHFFLTNNFDDGKRLGTIFKNKSKNDSLAVYILTKRNKLYYWAIDKVEEDHYLDLNYRYVSTWRFKFENSYTTLKNKLHSNQLKSNLYQNWISKFNYKLIDYDMNLLDLSKKLSIYRSILSDLDQISSLMPSNINKTDPAYKAVKELTGEIKNELAIVTKHQRLMHAYHLMYQSERSPQAFLIKTKNLNDYVQNQSDYPGEIQNELEKLIQERLKSSIRYMESSIRNKKDMSSFPFDIKNLLTVNEKINSLHRLKIRSLCAFFTSYNQFIPRYTIHKNTFQKILKETFLGGKWPSSSYYNGKQQRLGQLSNNLNGVDLAPLNQYRNYNSVQKLYTILNNFKKRLRKNISEYARAAKTVSNFTQLEAREKYSEMITEILLSKDILFLLRDYADLDRLSLRKRFNSIKKQIKSQEFEKAERALQIFESDQNFINLKNALLQRKLHLISLEEYLFKIILAESKRKAESSLAPAILQYTNVEKLYSDSTFRPIYYLTYSTKGPAIVDKRNKQIQHYLDNILTTILPAKGIEANYNAFIANPNKNGVARARTVVIHGNHYKGKNARLWNMVNECDPTRGKKISNTGQYRKVYALPKLNSEGDKNIYSFKMNIKIPTKSKFPAYEINIKLPKEIAAKATSDQWFNHIKLNGKKIRPEGRISITAPTRANGYEFQISPIQVKKNANNSFEVEFSNSAFKVFQISVMAQKPLIKKN